MTKLVIAINKEEKKSYSNENIDNVWINMYPIGSYIVIYMHDKNSNTATYIVNQEKDMKIVKNVETKNKNLKEVLPGIEVIFDKIGDKVKLGVTNSIDMINKNDT